MNELLTKALDRFKGSINLLVVDDDLHILHSIETAFASPVLKKTMIESYADAKKVTSPGNGPWHCWLLDIDLGEGRSGLDLMKAHPMFPYVIVLSGLQSMRVAAEAVNQGALAVFDKSTDTYQRIYEEMCRTAALGYVLDGKSTQYLGTYRLMGSTLFTTIEEWADKACITLRQLHRICEIHPIKSTRATLSTYYTLYTLLLKGRQPFTDELPPAIGQENAGYIAECIEYTLTRG